MYVDKVFHARYQYTEIQQCILEGRVFSYVGHLSLSGFGEMSEVVRETGTSPAELAEQERKKSKSIYAPMLRLLSYASLVGKAKLSLEVKM